MHDSIHIREGSLKRGFSFVISLLFRGARVYTAEQRGYRGVLVAAGLGARREGEREENLRRLGPRGCLTRPDRARRSRPENHPMPVFPSPVTEGAAVPVQR
jgi:hypothetical protein